MKERAVEGMKIQEIPEKWAEVPPMGFCVSTEFKGNKVFCFDGVPQVFILKGLEAPGRFRSGQRKVEWNGSKRRSKT